MRRTIDGTDYIAKSEVLRTIGMEITDAKDMQSYPDLCEDQRYGWVCREYALRQLRDLISNPEE